MGKKNGASDPLAGRKAELFAKLREDNAAIDQAMAAVGDAQEERRKTITALATECKVSALAIDGERYRIRKVKDSDPAEYDLQPVKALDFVEVD